MNFCVRIMKELAIPSWTHLCFFLPSFFLQVTGRQSDHYGDYIVTTISLPKTKFMKNSQDKSISTTITFHLPFWKDFESHQLYIYNAWHFHIHFSQQEFLFIHHAFPYIFTSIFPFSLSSRFPFISANKTLLESKS